MEHFKVNPKEQRTEAETKPCRTVYDLSCAGGIVADLRKHPEELKEMLRSPALFFALVRERNGRSENDSSFDDLILNALRRSPIVGEGTANRFREPEEPPVRDALRRRFGTDVGLRELKRTRIVDPKTGRPYDGIESNPDKPDPIGDFRAGMAAEAIVNAMRPGIMPAVFRYAEERGARDVETGAPIPGLENEVVAVMSVMEAVNGVTIGQIVDPDGVFWQRRYSARKPAEFLDFFRSAEYREYIRHGIEEAVRRHPVLLAVDWDHLPETLDATMKRFDTFSGGVAAIFGDGHMGNVGIVFADEDGNRLRPYPLGIMDPDLVRLSTRPDFGMLAEDYINPAKSTSLGTDYRMPDRAPEGMSRKEREPLGMDSVAILSVIFALIDETVREIIAKKSSDRAKLR